VFITNGDDGCIGGVINDQDVEGLKVHDVRL
jgi:hypothetical protein